MAGGVLSTGNTARSPHRAAAIRARSRVGKPTRQSQRRLLLPFPAHTMPAPYSSHGDGRYSVLDDLTFFTTPAVRPQLHASKACTRDASSTPWKTTHKRIVGEAFRFQQDTGPGVIG